MFILRVLLTPVISPLAVGTTVYYNTYNRVLELQMDDPYVKDKYGRTAMHWVAYHDH